MLVHQTIAPFPWDADSRKSWSLIGAGLFGACLVIIAGISAVDAFLNVYYPVTARTEENPLACWILVVTHDSVSVLIIFKAVGTALALGILASIYARRATRAILVAGVVALAQCYFLCYILIARGNETLLTFAQTWGR